MASTTPLLRYSPTPSCRTRHRGRKVPRVFFGKVFLVVHTEPQIFFHTIVISFFLLTPSSAEGLGFLWLWVAGGGGSLNHSRFFCDSVITAFKGGVYNCRVVTTGLWRGAGKGAPRMFTPNIFGFFHLLPLFVCFREPDRS